MSDIDYKALLRCLNAIVSPVMCWKQFYLDIGNRIPREQIKDVQIINESSGIINIILKSGAALVYIPNYRKVE